MFASDHNPPPTRPFRGGYTLLELLVVIGIIGLVLSSFALVLANYVQSAKVQATRTTIKKIDSILKQRMDAFRSRDFTDTANRIVAANNVTGVTKVSTAKALALKQAFRVTFPQQSADNTRAPFDAVDADFIAAKPAAESAAYLYLIVTKGQTYGTPTVDDSAFTSSETLTDRLDSNNDGDTTDTGEYEVTYFVDAWGEPLHYYRNPTRLFWLGEDVNGNGSLDSSEDDTDGDGNITPISSDQLIINQARAILAPAVKFVELTSEVHPLRVDPDDPLNRLRATLLNSGTFSPTQWTQFELFFQTPGVYSTPLIVSAGPDKTLGLEIPLNTTGSGASASRRANLSSASISPLTDNITNLNSQLQGGN